jgi:hypothetical protein
MPVRPTIKRVERVEVVLKAMKDAKKRGKSVQMVVGYSAPYAIYVHENLEINHPQHGDRSCGGQAKFLEQPMREHGERIMTQSMSRMTGTLESMLRRAAKALYEESQKLVPVLTGRLKESGFYGLKWQKEGS